MPVTVLFPGEKVGHAYAGPLSVVCTLRISGSGAAWVHAVGELDIATVPRLEQTLRRAELRARLAILDLRDAPFMDVCAVRVIVYATVRARRVRRRLIAVRGSAQVDRLRDLTGASTVLDIGDLDRARPAVCSGLMEEEAAAS